MLRCVQRPVPTLISFPSLFRSLAGGPALTSAETPDTHGTAAIATPALSWLRRRGPAVPHTLLYRLFRKRQVRVFDAQRLRVSRVSQGRVLQPGDIVLYPNHVLDGSSSWPATGAIQGGGVEAHKQHEMEAAEWVHSASGAGGGRGSSTGRQAAGKQAGGSMEGSSAGSSSSNSSNGSSALPVGSRPAVATQMGYGGSARVDEGLLKPRHVRRWVLASTPEMIFLNKPAGVDVQGPQNSLESTMKAALANHPGDDLKLVHRLDRNVSGVMVIARNADAATWLSACFKDKARQAVGDSQRFVPKGTFVRRIYQALVEGYVQPGQEGQISMPIVIDGIARPAVTEYRVKHSMQGITWLELEPKTGRRHQLRIHCARHLEAPIIGDIRYGARGVKPSSPLLRYLSEDWWGMFGSGRPRSAAGAGPIMLHAQKLLIKKSPSSTGLRVLAPLPSYMQRLMDALGWSLIAR